MQIVTLGRWGCVSRRPIATGGFLRFLTTFLVGIALLYTGCSRQHSDIPAIGSDAYRALCSAFYLGLAALQSGEDVNARKGLTRATELAPGEPAGWADLGLLQFRQQDYDGAYQSVQKAQALVPENSRIEALLGVIESRRGKTTETLDHLKRAVALDSGNLKALYGLAQETERQNSEAADAEAQKLLNQILRVHPNNVAVLVDLVRLAAKRNDAPQLRRAVADLEKNAPMWPDAAKQQLSALAKLTNSPNARPAAIQAQFLRNVLVRVPAYRQSLDEVKTPVTSAGEPFLRFLKMPSPRSDPSPPDLTTRFEAKPLANVPSSAMSWVGTFVADNQSAPSVIWADAESVHLGSVARSALPGQTGSGLAEHAVLAADLNYDFKTDLVLATDRGLRICQQDTPDRFTDVTAKANLPAAIVNGRYTGAWAFDVDLDGDLDVMLGVPDGEPLVLRNNGDSTYTVIKPFHGVNGLLDFVSADVDGDGDPDVALLDKEGHLKVFANERLGDYRARKVPEQLSGESTALAAADVNGDGLPDFVVLQADLRVMRLSDVSAGQGWSTGQLAQAKPMANGAAKLGLRLADLDNNGSLDLIVGDQAFLSDSHSFASLPRLLPVMCRAISQAGGAGRLNLIGLTADQKPVELVNSGTKKYHWQDVRPKAATTNGDQRINSFGIGGDVQIRADLLTQQQIITSPILHFGLGEHPDAEFARIVWPNGIIQTEFYLKANQTLIAEQRLKGSCPLLFTWNGKAMEFVKDVAPMSGALGAHDGAGKFAEISQTEEWFKINGNQLQPHDGLYDLRITDEYWEAYYIDHYGLLAVDHPAETEVFADERVATPAAPLKMYVTKEPRSFAAARDERGRDVSNRVENLDGRYLDTFALGAYQGIAQDHWVELTLPAEAPRQGPLYLIAEGWLHPWDDGALVAVNQGSRPKPQDLSIEVLDADGHWIKAAENLGVPAGREKTVVLDLSKIFRPGAPRKLRLRTNLEIYWDRLRWAIGVPEESVKPEHLRLAGAELRHRGYSQLSQRSLRSPEIPAYAQLPATGDKWRTLEGYYTRYGEVTPLLEKTDDRFVMMGGGDELRMKFRAAAPPLTGWSRDYILVGDGWMKEGDYSFKNSTTLLPLPTHAMKRYTGSAGALENDPVYLQHKLDWCDFHTRYIGPATFAAGLFERELREGQ